MSLYSQVSEEISSLEKVTYNKASMVAVSHALEDLVMEFDLKAEIFVTFQQFSFFLAEKDRYLKLEKQGCKLFIFCSQIDENKITEFETTTFIEIEVDNPLQEEWDLIINHPDQPMLLLTKEEKELQKREEDDFRVFSGILSFDPEIMKVVIDKLKGVLNEFDICYKPEEYSFTDISTQNRELNEKVSIFLNQALTELEKKNRDLLEAVSEKAAQESELRKARKLHRQFLPSELPKINGLSVASFYQPARHLGGDFYNFIHLENHLIFYIVDITGHSLDGALLNIFIRDTINNFLLSRQNKLKRITPIEIFDFVSRRYQQEEFSEDYFVCLTLGKVDLSTMKVNYANAGIHVPVLFQSSDQIKGLKNFGLPITNAVEPSELDYKQEGLILEPGDRLLFTTDGIIELTNQNNRYGFERLKQLLSENLELDSDGLITELKQDIAEFKNGTEVDDDLTAIIIERS